jgi:MFS family permease
VSYGYVELELVLEELTDCSLATATPSIVADFQQINDVAFYHAAYGIGQMVAQPTIGKIYTYFDIKWTYGFSFLIFEVGSILCAAAPNSLALIIGRATAGVGYAGLYSGGMLIIIDSVPLRRRPLYMSLIGTMFAGMLPNHSQMVMLTRLVAGVTGPLLGGIFTDTKRLTWRFAFWINLRRCILI